MQAQKVVEKEAAVRVNVAWVYKATVAKVAKVAKKGRCTTRTLYCVEGHQANEGVRVGNNGFRYKRTGRLWVLLISSCNDTVWFVNALCMYGASFLQPPSLQYLSRHFFFPSSSTLPPFSQFDIHPQSTMSIARFSLLFQVSPIVVQA